MNRAVDLVANPALPVPAEEIERRIHEYRQAAFEHRATPVVVYSPADHPCPWPGCDLQISGLNIKLEELVEPARNTECLREFWLGSGLVAPCPSCANLVAYGVRGKRAVREAGLVPHLPANWYQIAHVVLAKKS